MEYREAAERLAALAICTEQVPKGCEECPAYREGEDGKKQRQACNDMLKPEKVEEAIEVVREYEKKRPATTADSTSN